MPDRRVLSRTIGIGIAAGVLALGMVWTCTELTDHFMNYMMHSPVALYWAGMFGRFAWIPIPIMFLPFCLSIQRRRPGRAEDM